MRQHALNLISATHGGGKCVCLCGNVCLYCVYVFMCGCVFAYVLGMCVWVHIWVHRWSGVGLAGPGACTTNQDQHALVIIFSYPATRSLTIAVMIRATMMAVINFLIQP